MTVFADASALVKLYADEPGAELVRGLGHVVVSASARVEVPAALWRKHRTGELSAQDARLLAAEFAADWHEPAGPFIAVMVQVGCSNALPRWWPATGCVRTTGASWPAPRQPARPTRRSTPCSASTLL